MRIEALKPLKVKRPSGDIVLTPGAPVEFSDDEGKRLLEKVPGKVRLIEDPVQVGMVVEWDSPLFGLLSGVVLEVNPHTITVLHPLVEDEATIPRVWLKIWQQKAGR